jgi:FixJ family two-component response regulator
MMEKQPNTWASGTMMQQATVYIVDDDRSLRAALESLFASVGQPCCCYASVQDFLAGWRDGNAGCLLLDVRMPGIGGLEFQAQVDRHGISLPIVMMTGFGDVPMTVRAMKAGAVDFLTKPFRDQELLDAVSAAMARDAEARRSRADSEGVRRAYDSLTRREREVMVLVTAGKLNKQVAGDLGLSEITVKIHRGSVMRKMGARTLPELVRMADTLGLVAGVIPG